jgi:hypothetical protein
MAVVIDRVNLLQTTRRLDHNGATTVDRAAMRPGGGTAGPDNGSRMRRTLHADAVAAAG